MHVPRQNFATIFLGLTISMVAFLSLSADPKSLQSLLVEYLKISLEKTDDKIPLSRARIVFDGFAPTSEGVGPSPSNQAEADDPFRYFEVVLPQGYDDPMNAEREYPVIYFLHGFGLNHTCYGLLTLFLAELTEFILVKPDASIDNGYLGSFYTNSLLNGRFEQYLAQELPDYIDATYRTIKSKDGRLLFGHSMGAYGALLLAINHPNRFGLSFAFSPPPIIAINPLAKQPDFYEDVRLEIPDSGDGAGKVLPTNGPNSYQLFAWSAALSPNENSPFLVDLPILVDSNFVPVITDGMLTPNHNIIKKWEKNDPLTLIEDNLALAHNLGIFVATDKHESLSNKHAARIFDNHLNRLGIDHGFHIYPESLFSQPPELRVYSPSNDIPLKLVFPTLERVTNFLVDKHIQRPRLLVDLVVKALQTDPALFSSVSLANFGPFLNYCEITPPGTIGELLVDSTFRSCLSDNGFDPRSIIDGYFEIAQLMNIDPSFFSIAVDGLGGLIG